MASGSSWTQVFASTDTSEWAIKATLSTNSFIDDIHYADRMWVAASGLGGLPHSDNALDWKTHPQFSAEQAPYLYDLEFHDGLFIASGQNRIILKFSDGKTWTSHLIDEREEPDWLTVAHYSEQLQRWCLGGDFGRVWSSPDNLTDWTHGILPIEQDIEAPFFRHVTMIDSQWVLTGSPAGRIYTSEDGKTWEREPSIAYPERGSIQHIQLDESRLIAVGQTPFGGALILESSQAVEPPLLVIEETSRANLVVKWSRVSGPEALEMSTDLKTFSTVTRGISILGGGGAFEHHFRKEAPNKYYRLKKQTSPLAKLRLPLNHPNKCLAFRGRKRRCRDSRQEPFGIKPIEAPGHFLDSARPFVHIRN